MPQLMHAYLSCPLTLFPLTLPPTQASKLIPPSSSSVIRLLQQDSYYAPLLVLAVPVTIAAVSAGACCDTAGCMRGAGWCAAHTMLQSNTRTTVTSACPGAVQCMFRWGSMKLFQTN